MSDSFVKISESIIQDASASFGMAIYPSGGSWGGLQRGFQVLLVVSGSIELRLGRERTLIPAGHAILCPPHRKELFIFSSEMETQSIWCTMMADLVPEELRKDLLEAGEMIPISTTLRSLVELGLNLPASSHMRTSRKNHFERGHPQKLIKSLSEHDALDQFTVQLGLCVLQCFLADRAEKLGREHGADPRPLEKARQFIHEHFAEEINLTLLAQRASVTPNHLIKLFRERIGVPPIEYLWQIRLDQSIPLLRETGLSISEIAYQTGFKNPFHFARRFRTRFGSSPRSFRRGYQSADGLN